MIITPRLIITRWKTSRDKLFQIEFPGIEIRFRVNLEIGNFVKAATYKKR